MSRHVALVIPTLAAIGGAERVVLELAAGLTERNWRVTLIALSGDVSERRQQWMAERKIAFLSLRMRKAWIDPRGWADFYTWQRREQPDVLHGHLAHGAWFARSARLTCSNATRPVEVDTLHSTRLGGPWTARLYQWTDQLSGCVTAVSEAVRDAALKTKAAAKICVVRNGIALESFSRRQQESRTEHAFVWLAVGRLAAVKDYPRLLRAFARVAGLSDRETRLEIAGDGEQMQQLQALAIELGIVDRVRWHGFCEDVAALLHCADAVVLASRWEGLPMCLIEAGAAGVPVVTTATAGALEVVMPNVTGRVVAVDDDENSLSEAMLQVMAMSAQERAEMGAAARSHGHEHFSRERMVLAYEQIYERLLRARSL